MSLSADQHARPILVTGSHRSGTTWVGKMLAQSDAVGYVDEPFRPDQRPGIFDSGIEQWFAYAPDCDERRLGSEIRKLLRFDYSFGAELQAIAHPKDALRMGRDAVRFFWKRLQGLRPLFKDPIAVLSAEWLADTFDFRVVVMLRHPAAFAYSLQRKQWAFPFDHLLNQPRLMEEHLNPYREDIRTFANQPRSIIEQAGLLWTLIYQTVLSFLDDHPNWIVVRHEDLARHPVEQFRDLYGQLGLAYTAACQESVRAASRAENPTEPPDGRVKNVQRDSQSLVGRWREALGEDEIQTVREQTRSISEVWYDRSSWP